MKEMFKLGFVLAAFAVVACVALALVNNVTAPKIAAVKEAEAAAAMKAVFPQAETFENAAGFAPFTLDTVDIMKLSIAKSGGNTLGAVVQAAGNTYGRAELLVGVASGGKITGIQFLALTDSPGYGQKAKTPAFMGQFADKPLADKFALGADITAISGATISSRTITHIIKTAATLAGNYLAEGEAALKKAEAGK